MATKLRKVTAGLYVADNWHIQVFRGFSAPGGWLVYIGGIEVARCRTLRLAEKYLDEAELLG